MRKLSFSAAPLLFVFGASFGGCQDQNVTVPLRSLASSGDVSYVCRVGNGGPGVPLEECHRRSLLRGERDLIGLVTQTSRGEVALVNVPFDPNDPASDEGVIDVDPSLPGYNFLRVGARPGDILSTPDGQASFVTAADVQKPGIFGLPTSCLGPPSADQTLRDVTTWPACSLASVPGEIELVLDAESTCGAGEPATSSERECPATLSTPGGGRWKLLVSMPSSGSIGVIDAQWLLDRAPGTYEPCQIEAEYPLEVKLPAVPPTRDIPEDLLGCAPAPLPTREAPPAFAARPAALALGDGVLYAADEQSPVIHRLDVTRPCAAAEMQPLLPLSFDNPNRVVTASTLAVSPLTPSGKRYVYAVDETDLPLSSVMVFDVSAGSSDRTPIIRPGSTYIPGESPDRLRFTGAVQDVIFLYRDTPVLDPVTGTAVVGEQCNPLPNASLPGTKYQPDEDFTTGASATELRGVFAMALLSNGQISVVDVEDLDAPCRRPASINRSSTMDFRGCSNDAPADPLLQSYADESGPTVTDEVSCRMVQPHRHRSAFLGINDEDIGTRAPALRGFPILDVPSNIFGRARQDLPKLLGVDSPGVDGDAVPAQVYVGSTLYTRSTGNQNVFELSIDPSTADRHSLVLPFIEPRAYVPEPKALVFEGVVTASTSGVLTLQGDGTALLTDGGANYCNRGVHDVELMRDIGEERFALSGAALETFASSHADTVVITADFPEEDDAYWSGSRECSRAECEQVFGELDAEPLLRTRDLQVLDADQQRLVVTGGELELAACCFPGGFDYEVRASQQWLLVGQTTGVRHNVTAARADDGSYECVRDCNPRKRWDVSRVFEVSCGSGSCGFGASTESDPARCVVDAPLPFGVTLDEPAASCVHDTPTARFAVYRGLQPSERGMTFLWEIVGGFVPLGLDMAQISSAVLPQRAVEVRSLDWLTVVDGSSLGLGLVVIDLNDLSVNTPPIN